MTDDRVNLKLSSDTGAETRTALRRYRDGHKLDNLEQAIRHLLPNWTFQSDIPPEVAVIIENSKHYSFVDPKAKNLITISGFLDDDTRQLFIGSSGNSSWEKQIAYVRGLIQDIQQTADSVGFELTELSIYDIGTVDEFIDAGFGRDGNRRISELGEYCEGRAQHIGDCSVSGVSGAATLAETFETVGKNQLVVIIPKGSPVTDIANPSVPTTLHFQEDISQSEQS